MTSSIVPRFFSPAAAGPCAPHNAAARTRPRELVKKTIIHPLEPGGGIKVTATTKLIRIITRIIALSPIIGAISGVINIIKWLTDD